MVEPCNRKARPGKALQPGALGWRGRLGSGMPFLQPPSILVVCIYHQREAIDLTMMMRFFLGGENVCPTEPTQNPQGPIGMGWDARTLRTREGILKT